MKPRTPDEWRALLAGLEAENHRLRIQLGSGGAVYRAANAGKSAAAPTSVAQLVCPLSGCLFEDPIVASDGFTYSAVAFAGKTARPTPGHARRRPPLLPNAPHATVIDAVLPSFSTVHVRSSGNISPVTGQQLESTNTVPNRVVAALVSEHAALPPGPSPLPAPRWS